jgi:D-glycero-alpha-D-manno-heptose 1-phosphate guanylyltransferase
MEKIYREAIVLAGGLGTRLKGEVPDLPKCLAPVAEKPFLDYIIQYLLDQKVDKIIFALGVLHEKVTHHLTQNWPDLSYAISIESEPLGTGGAISLAANHVTSDTFFVLNGDTYFDIKLDDLAKTHTETQAKITLALKPMSHFDRYGSVVLEDQIITHFNEKVFMDFGLINGGIYLLERAFLTQNEPATKYSFEKEILEPSAARGVVSGCICDGYFIDIGIPEDYQKANQDFLQL